MTEATGATEVSTLLSRLTDSFLPFRDPLYVPATALLIGYVVPVYVIQNNITDLQHIDVRLTFIALLLVSLPACLLLWAVSLGLSKLRITRALFPVFRFFFFFGLLSGLFLPLTQPAGQIEAAEIPLRPENLVLVTVLAACLTMMTLTPLHGSVFSAAMTVLLGSATISTISVARGIGRKNVDVLYDVSSDRNVFVVSFDGWPRDATIEVIQSSPELSRSLKDFTVFSQAISSALGTYGSIRSELSGVPNLLGSGDSRADGEPSEVGGPLLLPNVLAERGFLVSTYGAYGSGFADSSRSFGYGTLARGATTATRVAQTAEIIEYSLARVASSHFVVGRDLAIRLAGNIWHDEGRTRGYSDDLHARIANHSGPSWDVSNILTVLDLDEYVTKLRVARTGPVAHFLHFVHTHYPVDFDRTCTYRSDDPAWYAANQNRHGLKEQLYCSLSQFSRLLSTLRRLGIYESSLIVLKSDHGEPVSYNDRGRYEGFTVRGHEHWGLARHTPFLAIKAPGAVREQPAVDDRHVALSDLANSVCRGALSTTFDCSVFRGYDLLDPAASIPDGATYFVYVAKDAKSSWRLGDHEAIELPRKGDFFAVLNDRLTSELIPRAPACGTTVDVSGGAPYNTGRTDKATWVTWRNQDTLYLKVRRPECSFESIVLSLGRDENVHLNPEDLVVRVNGHRASRIEARTVSRAFEFDMERGTAEWRESGATVTWVGSSSYEGSANLQLATMSPAGYASRSVTVQAGERMRLQAALVAIGGVSSPALLRVRNRHSGSYLASGGVWSQEPQHAMSTSATSWESQAVEFTVEDRAASGTDTPELQIDLVGTNAGFRHRYDAILLLGVAETVADLPLPVEAARDPELVLEIEPGPSADHLFLEAFSFRGRE